MVRSLIMSLAIALAACNAATEPGDDGSGADLGTIAGTVSFIGVPCPPDEIVGPPCNGRYPDYEVEVYRRERPTLAARTMSDATGHYEVELRAGDYLIFTRNGIRETDLARHEVTVVAGEVTTLDLVIDIGIR